MKPIRSEGAWDHNLRRRLSRGATAQRFRLRNLLYRIDEEIRTGARKSPNSWAVCCSICAGALKGFAGLRDRERWQSMIGHSPNRILKLMAECAKRAKAGAAAYRERGINPQARVTIDPHLAKARAALAAWRARLAAETKR